MKKKTTTTKEVLVVAVVFVVAVGSSGGDIGADVRCFCCSLFIDEWNEKATKKNNSFN